MTTKSSKLYKLTDEHRAQFEPWRDKWISNAMSAQPMSQEDREICIEAVNGLYASARLPLPKHIVFVPSPFVLTFAAGFAAAIWNKSHRVATRDVTRDATRDVTRDATRVATRDATEDATWTATEAATRDATRDATRAATWAATWAATEAATWAATLGATRAATEDATRAATWDATEAATWTATLGATRAATWAATEDATRAATWDATEAATRAATWAATLGATEAATWAATEDATEDATPNPSWYRFGANMPVIDKFLGLNGFGLSLAREAYRWFQGGNQWSGYDSYLSFFRHVAQLPLDYSSWQHWETLSLHSGPRIVHADFCMICDRPELLLVDENNRPHNQAGPFCRWRDGSSLYSVRGVRVPWDVIENPSTITVDRIKKESNSEVRRVMIDLYGQAKYIADAKLRLLDSSIWGDLYQEECASGVDAWTAVRVINGTPDPATGEKAIYILPVHHECRPMWIDENGQKQFGEPQKLTALNAVASTYGATGKDYEAGFLGRS